MTRTWIAALAGTGLLLSASASVRAKDLQVPDRGQLTVNLGAGFGSGHLIEPQSVTEGPAVYAGLELHVRIRRPLGMGVVAGGSNVTGWFLGANVRAEAHAGPRLFLSTGVGPLVVTSGNLAGLVFVGWDASLSVRFTSNSALTIGPMLAFATNHQGTPGCGVDTCNAWAVPGDTLFLVRAGFGAAF